MAPPARPSFLVVDDDDLMLVYFKRMLETAGFECWTAPSADAGLDVLRRTRPDAVICDLHMPKRNGVSFLKALRSHEDWRTLPVAIVTRDLAVTKEVVAEVSALGAAFLAGVVTRSDLLGLAAELMVRTTDLNGR
jgi:CheY-like chemotaxis protein